MIVRDQWTDTQIAIYQDSTLNLAISGGLGSAKTALTPRIIVAEIAKYPGCSLALAAPSYPQLFQSNYVELEERLTHYGIRWKYKHDLHRISFSNGSKLRLVSFEVKEARIKGAEYDAGIIDEGDAVEYAHYQRFADRIGRKVRNKGSGRIWVFANPVPYSHWIYQDFRLSKQPNHKLVEIPTYANRRFLAPGYIEKLEARYPKGTIGHKRWILGRCGIPDERAVYADFDINKDRITIEEVEEVGIKHWRAALNPGEGHPTGYVLTAILQDGTIVIWNEIFAEGGSKEAVAERINQIDKTTTVLADHKQPSYKEYRKTKLPMAAANANRRVGISRLRSFVAEGRVKMLVQDDAMSAPHLHSELENHRTSEVTGMAEEMNCSVLKALEFIACAETQGITTTAIGKSGLLDALDTRPAAFDHPAFKHLQVPVGRYRQHGK